MHRPRVELAIFRSQVRRPNRYTTEPPALNDSLPVNVRGSHDQSFFGRLGRGSRQIHPYLDPPLHVSSATSGALPYCISSSPIPNKNNRSTYSIPNVFSILIWSRQDHASWLVGWLVTLVVSRIENYKPNCVKFCTSVQHLCQMSLLTFETSRSKFKVKTAVGLLLQNLNKCFIFFSKQ